LQDKEKRPSSMSAGLELSAATFRHMKKPYQLLIIPLTIWSGLEQGFFGSDFYAVRVNVVNVVKMITPLYFARVM
jgi:hypothetical protein